MVIKMNKKKGFAIFFCILILVLSSVCTVYADSSDLYQGLEDLASASGDTNFIEYRDHYKLDTEKISFFKNPASVILDLASNFLFTLQVELSKVLIILFSNTLECNVSMFVQGFLQPFIGAMESTIFSSFSLIFISLAALILLLRLLQNRKSQFISGMVTLLLVLVLSVVFFTHPMELISGLDSATQEISSAVMDAPYEASGHSPGGDVSGKSSALLWNLLVHKPWQVLEFGSVSVAEAHQEEILKLEPDSEDRQKLIDELAEEKDLFSKSSAYQTVRCVSSLLLLLFNVVLILVLAAFCILIIGYQFLFIIYVLLGIFVFLLALIPYYGLELLKKWGIRIFAVLSSKILLVLFLSILMVMMETMYGFVDSYGLLFVLFMIAIIIGIVYIKREDLFSLFADINVGAVAVRSTPQTLNRMVDQDFNALDKLRNLRYRSDGAEAPVSIKNGSASERSEGRTSGASRSETADREQAEAARDLKRAASDMEQSTQNLSAYYSKAEDLLQKHYEESKKASEERSAGKGEAQYSNFVTRTNAVRKLGGLTFDPRDVSNLARIIRITEQRGGDISNIIAPGDTSVDSGAKMERPKALEDRAFVSQSNGRRAVSLPENRPEKKTGMEYFKANFGEERGEEFYEKMSKKYSPDVLREFQFDDKIATSGATSRNSTGKVSYAAVERQLKQQQKAMMETNMREGEEGFDFSSRSKFQRQERSETVLEKQVPGKEAENKMSKIRDEYE